MYGYIYIEIFNNLTIKAQLDLITESETIIVYDTIVGLRN